MWNWRINLKIFFLESQGKCGRNEMQSENQTRMSVFYEKEFLKEQYSQVIPWFCLVFELCHANFRHNQNLQNQDYSKKETCLPRKCSLLHYEYANFPNNFDPFFFQFEIILSIFVIEYKLR